MVYWFNHCLLQQSECFFSLLLNSFTEGLANVLIDDYIEVKSSAVRTSIHFYL